MKSFVVIALVSVVGWNAGAHPRSSSPARVDEQSNTVMGRFLDVTLEDARDPAKIAAAFERAPAELVYSATKEARLSLETVGGARGCDTGDSAKITTSWRHNGEASGLEIYDANVDATQGVPLLIWQRQGNRALVVSLDGLRYTTEDVTKLMRGVPPRAGWPTSPHLVCVNNEMAVTLVERNELDAGLVAKAGKAMLAVGACVTRVWRSGERELAANDTANINPSTRANRYSALLDKYTTKVERGCAARQRAYETAMLAVIASYAKPRSDALAAATVALEAK
jgi:hypothetical protein